MDRVAGLTIGALVGASLALLIVPLPVGDTRDALRIIADCSPSPAP